MRTVVAVDAGGTTTRAVLLDESGHCLGVGRAGGANPIALGAPLAMANVVSALLRAVAGHVGAAPELVLMTMAGAIASPDLGGEEAQLSAAGVTARVEFEADILSAWFSGTASGDGTVLVVGTGAVAGVVSKGSLVRIVDGGGWLLGDTGSGFWIGREVVRAVAEHLDGRGPATALTEAVMARVAEAPDRPGPGFNNASHRLLRHVYGASPVTLAEFAPLTLRYPDDAVASDIVARAAAAVERTARVAVDPASQDPIVLAGGLLGEGSPITQHLVEAFGDRCIRVESGLAGAALLALRHLGIPSGETELGRIRASLAQISPPVIDHL